MQYSHQPNKLTQPNKVQIMKFKLEIWLKGFNVARREMGKLNENKLK